MTPLDVLVALNDAPLFINADLTRRFYLSVTGLTHEEGQVDITVSEESAQQATATLGIEAGLEPGGLGAIISKFLKGSLKASGEVGVDRQWTEGTIESFTLKPVNTPERQLKQLVAHYMANHIQRLLLVPDPSEPEWRRQDLIEQVPRALCVVDLPGLSSGGPSAKLIPTAAEFMDGQVVQLYEHLIDRLTQNAVSGGKKPDAPQRYPEGAGNDDPDELIQKRREYWAWFDKYYSATQAMITVEEAASKHGAIRWIDYRVPIAENGDTLHLHCYPDGEYDTGSFAYNFIKRGYKHGLRLVGTLKSEPDMNVLAVYEK